MSIKQHDTPMLDQLESGPWPSFVTGLKRLAKDSEYMTDLGVNWSIRTKPARVTGRAAPWGCLVTAVA